MKSPTLIFPVFQDVRTPFSNDGEDGINPSSIYGSLEYIEKFYKTVPFLSSFFTAIFIEGSSPSIFLLTFPFLPVYFMIKFDTLLTKFRSLCFQGDIFSNYGASDAGYFQKISGNPSREHPLKTKNPGN